MASSTFCSLVLLMLRLTMWSHGVEGFNIGSHLKSAPTFVESTMKTAEVDLKLVELKLHIDQSIALLWSKLEAALDDIHAASSVVCADGVQKDEKLLSPRGYNDCPDLEPLRSEITEQLKAVREGQEQVSARLANVSSSRELKVARLEHVLREDSLDVQVYLTNPGDLVNGSFYVKTSRAVNRAYGDDWIIFQQRYDGTVDFYRNWTEYRDGFGDLGGEFWLGLEKLHRIMASGATYELLIELEDFEGVRAYEHYDEFAISAESEDYELKKLGKASGTAGDSMVLHRGRKFSTFDHSTNDCPTFYHGAWWFLQCYDAHLNGKYLIGKQTQRGGNIWHTFRGSFESLQATKMMIRPLALIDRAMPKPEKLQDTQERTTDPFSLTISPEFVV
uniref:Fibrinogen C-terminal domain-containing protein n=1 Tax=Anopheles dirus TaxID=7168 RepID=A0A182NJN5_9DIPT